MTEQDMELRSRFRNLRFRHPHAIRRCLSDLDLPSDREMKTLLPALRFCPAELTFRLIFTTASLIDGRG